jgi:hypothetical protein
MPIARGPAQVSYAARRHPSLLGSARTLLMLVCAVGIVLIGRVRMGEF